MTNWEINQGDALSVLKAMPDESVQMCVTSPPYFGLRDYGVDGQIGLEATPQAFVAALVEVFEEVRRVLKPDGTCWVNLGDSYASGFPCNRRSVVGNGSPDENTIRTSRLVGGLKEKDLIGIPWRVAFALQEAGWWLRQDIIWSKPNPMPESVTDRCTKAHEYIFLLSKSAKYFYDSEAIKEPFADASIARLTQNVESQNGSARVPGKANGTMKAVGALSKYSFKRDDSKRGLSICPNSPMPTHRPEREDGVITGMRNKRSVWSVTTLPYSEAHFATFPEKLIEPCILAGSREGDTVLDPFNGAGTSGLVSIKHRRNYIGIELNPEYVEISKRRLAEVQVKLF